MNIQLKEHPVMKRMFSVWTLIAVLVAAFCWLYAVFIEISIADPHVPASINSSVPMLLRNRPTIDFLINLGFSLIIARIVAIVVDHETENRLNSVLRAQEDFFQRKTHEIAQKAFYGVLTPRFPKEYVDATLKLAFSRPIIRAYLESTYWIEDARYEISPGSFENCVVLRVYSAMEYVNLGEFEDYVPIRFALPRPRHPGRRKLVRFDELKIAGRDVDQNAISANFDRQLEASDDDHIWIDGGLITLLPGGRGIVEIKYQLFKNTEDSEIMRSLLACKRIKVSVFDRTRQHAYVGLTQVHPSPFVRLPSPIEERIYAWELRDYTVPHQGYILHWSIPQ